jgi:DNA-binding GntR family transcriptional regulator
MKKSRIPKPTATKARIPGGNGSKLGHRAYEHLKGKLLKGELGAGDKISEVRLAADLRMSRTPVREAIRRLEVEGVLRAVASSGTFVKPAERSAIIEVYELRMAIECFAVQKAARCMKPARMRQLQQFCDRMREAVREFRATGGPRMQGAPLRRYLAADVGFHLLLLEEAQNRHLSAIYNDLHLRSAIFGLRSHARDLRHVARVWRQHERVARAVGKRDARAALQALEQHMQTSMEAALEMYDARMAGRAAPAGSKY